ncbi:nonribosomal peptide synthetase MxaA [Ancylobacter sp. SL191]|uniref:nonribosomal peptide synthetase MxaA n=1 Tax=Ancylobacter sp. SL191 TaxID=2995166 RepID=UPI0022706B3D|nr:nonribosomal peptide synthetase MxaA [Ancylobacter sp. SL191]WAC26227.1 nonribosomal peptide synthetase MxaA [Ancylobacter sp. SL191]
MRFWRALLPLLLLTALAGPAMAQLRSVELYAPRPFGYLIGDTIRHTVEIALDAPFTLEPASLPQPRPVDYWLDLRAVDLRDEGMSDGVQRYRLELTYQSFYAALEPKRLEIPGFTLYARDGERRVPVAVPPWSFLMSPLREIVSTEQGAVMTLRPDIAPRPIPTTGTIRGLIGGGVAALAGLLLIAWQMGWGTFGQRRGRPFARAARQVRAAMDPRRDRSHSLATRGPVLPDTPASSSTSLHSSSSYEAALQALHRAFDMTAGQGVFAEDLPGFFAGHAAFRVAEAEIRRLFEASRRAFFGGDVLDAQRIFPPSELAALAGRLRAIERGSA